jgi:hypothetical protein
MQFTWKITKITQTQNVWKNNTPKRTVVLVDDDTSQYPNSIAVDWFWKKIADLDWFKVWDLVQIEINCRCVEYWDKLYNWLSIRSILMIKKSGVLEMPLDDDLPF